MKKTLATLLLIAPLTLGLTGCIIVADGDGGYKNMMTDHDDREYDNRKKIARLEINTDYSDAQDRLGVADFNESFEQDGQNIQVLYYRTNRKHADSMTTKDECTYLQFVDGKFKQSGAGEDFSRNTGL